MNIRKYLTSILVAATLVVSGGIAHAEDRPLVGPDVPLPKAIPGAVVAGKPWNLHPLCRHEDSLASGQETCRWDARLLGNGRGDSYIRTREGLVYHELTPSPARGTLAFFPQCPQPIYTGQICWYSANTRGNGLGRDYYFTRGGVKKTLPYQMIES